MASQRDPAVYIVNKGFYVVAKSSKFVYHGRVRKIILILALPLSSAFLMFFLSPKQAFAEPCSVTVDPTSVPEDYEGNIQLNSVNTNCFGIDFEYKIIAYPSNKKIKDVNKLISATQYVSTFSTPVIANKVESDDAKNLNGHMNFKDESSLGTTFFKPHDIGVVWTVLACNSQTNTNDCDQEKNIVAQGTFDLQPIPPTPTPTPQQDQPIVLVTDQDTCRFQLTNTPKNLITIRVKNINLSQAQYVWWTDWDKTKKTANLSLITQPIPSISNTPPPAPTPIYKLEIAQTEDFFPPAKKHPEREEGHLLCIDVMGKDREGANCLRLFFTSRSTQENDACSEANSGAVTPSPITHLPPCANWTYANNTPIPTPQEEFIRQNNLRDMIKCGAIHTGVGDISTNPQSFISFIFSMVLGLAGGISLILIMISGYRIMASSGNPEALAAGRQQLISAIVGLLFIIFSFVILEVIGVDILRIPGFDP